ncbi:ABC-type anion transport system, duplicated permease component [Serratia fonticola]|uniref:ABC-type anion transport system, duplicated permease component n=1 Tax=Serratia fonticola TaxID=47917 RepID=A0A4U9W4Q4_SERFO|nr:ABC-type anion transport system, duplicated permease component [Serratia fonticola]
MGLECTAIFAVFTGQAWNMMLTLYQTLRIVPSELDEAARSFNYNPWQRFWRLEVYLFRTWVIVECHGVTIGCMVRSGGVGGYPGQR